MQEQTANLLNENKKNAERLENEKDQLIKKVKTLEHVTITYYFSISDRAGRRQRNGYFTITTGECSSFIYSLD